MDESQMNAYELADDVIHMLESWSEAYPTSMFPDPTQEDIDYINAENKNLSARFFAHVGRHFINKGFTPAIDMLRQQAGRIAELEKQSYRQKHEGFSTIIDKTTPQTKPLSDEEIEILASLNLCYQIEDSKVSGVFNFARAIEAKVRGNK